MNAVSIDNVIRAAKLQKVVIGGFAILILTNCLLRGCVCRDA